MKQPLAFTAATLSIGTFIVGADKIRMPGGYVLDNGPSRAPWLVSGMLMSSILPCALRRLVVGVVAFGFADATCIAGADTMKFMMPLNKQLLLAESNAQPRAWKSAKLSLWTKLHHFRTAASCAALGFVVYKFVAKDD